MASTITHDEERRRFSIQVDGNTVGVADYHEDDATWVFTHTEVQPEYGGRGLAGQLVDQALREAIAAGKTITPVCSYVAAYIERHPEFHEHVVPPS